MTNILPTIIHLLTIRTLSTALLVLILLWFLKLMIKQEFEHLFRASMTLVFVFLVFIFFQRSHIGEWDAYDIKAKIFPEKPPTLNYRVERGALSGDIRLRYVFQAPKPKLNLTLDKKGDHLHLWNISSLNAVLKSLELPMIKSGVPELSAITGSRFDTGHYRWENYPLGVLIIVRELCQDRQKLQSYPCLATLTIKYRK
ncbi:MAG: hypothetical protein ACE5L7_07290 [Candidatus Aminicenantales bacterium]